MYTIKSIRATKPIKPEKRRRTDLAVKIFAVLLIAISIAVTYKSSWNSEDERNKISNKTVEYVDNTLKHSAELFLVVRALQGTLSILQHSQLSVSPAGIGAIVAVGRFWDPIISLVRNLGDMLFYIVVFLGVQKMLITMSLSQEIWILFSLSSIMFAGSLFVINSSNTVVMLKRWVGVLFITAVLLRFVAVWFVVFSGWFIHSFLEEDLKNKEAALQQDVSVVQTESSSLSSVKTGFFSKFSISKIISSTKSKATELYKSTKEFITILLVEIIFIPGLFVLAIIMTYKLFSTLFIAGLSVRKPIDKE